MAETKRPDASGGAITAGHELSDLRPRTVAIFGLALAVVVVACLIVAAWMFDLFAARRAKEDMLPFPPARVETPAGPVLQVNAPTDLARLRAEEDATLSTYAWVDRGAGIVRIPIHQAMQLLLLRGMPASPGQPAGTAKAR